MIKRFVLKRFILVLLLISMPLQAVWAGASTYCEHERCSNRQHFGHHVHQHKAAGDTNPENSPYSNYDPDCGFCHLGSTGIVTSGFEVPTPLPVPEARAADNRILSSVFIEQPERPKWVSAV